MLSDTDAILLLQSLRDRAERIRENASAAKPAARRHLDLLPELLVRQSCGVDVRDCSGGGTRWPPTPTDKDGVRG